MRWHLGGRMEPLDELAAKVSYFTGADPSRWRINAPTYAKVRYKDIYPGIDLVYYGNHNDLECDFIVAPGTDPNQIRLTFDGSGAPSVAENGDLVLGEIRLRKPVLYQEDSGSRRSIDGRFTIVHGAVAFEVAEYDATKALVIDPVLTLTYSSYLGGTGEDSARAVGVDAAGNVYVTGYTADANAAFDGFLFRFTPNGLLTHSVYFGGDKSDIPNAIAVTKSGHVHIVGATTSKNNFPILQGAPYPALNGFEDAFIMTFVPVPDQQNPGNFKLMPQFASYFGGNGNEEANGVSFATDPDDSTNEDFIYVTGSTNSTTGFPVINSAVPDGGHLSLGKSNEQDVFVAQVNTAKNKFNFATYLGGSGRDRGFAIAGSGYITGETCSADFVHAVPAVPVPFQVQSPNNLCHAFYAHVEASGGMATLFAFTYLGGSGYNAGHGIAPASGFNGSSLVIVGEIEAGQDTDFPQSQNSYGQGVSDGFIAVMSADGHALEYFRYLGGQGDDQGFAVAVDKVGQIYATGVTCANISAMPPNTFPQVNPLPSDAGNGVNSGYSPQIVDGTGCDAFVVKLDWDRNVAYSTYLGGKGYDIGWGIAVDQYGAAYVAGSTVSNNFPVTNLSAFGGGVSDAFLSRLEMASPSAKGPLAYTNLGDVFDTDTDLVLKNFKIPLDFTKTPLVMRPDGAMLYAVSNTDDPSKLDIVGVDLSTYKASKLGAIPLAGQYQDAALAVTPDSNVLFAGSHVESLVRAYNTAANLLSLEQEFVYPLHTACVAVHPDFEKFNGFKAFVSHETGALSWIHRDQSAANYQTGPASFVTVPADPMNMVVTPDGAWLLSAKNGDSVTFVNATNDTVDSTITVGSSVKSIAVTPKPIAGAYWAYVSNTSQGTCSGVTAINTSSKAMTCIPIPGKTARDAIAVTPDAKKVYVADGERPATWVIDTASNKVVNVILGVTSQPIGQSGTGIVIAPQDHNKNGISEEVDVDDENPASKSFTGQQFGESGGGTITDNGGTRVSVWHSSPKGFWVRSSVANNHDAQIDATCVNQPSVSLAPGSLAQLVCGSLTVRVMQGRAKLNLGGGVFGSITAGGSGKVTGSPGSYVLQNIGNTTIALVNASNQTIGSVPAGQSYPAAPIVSCSPIAPITYDGAPHGVPNGTCTANASGSFSDSYSSGSAPVNVGSYAFTATFTSSDPKFANGSAAGTITITYNVCPLFDAAKPVNGGATLPIKLQVCSATGANASSAAIVLTAVKVTNATTKAVTVPADAGGSNPDQHFRFESNAYMYNLKTTGLSAGPYTLTFSVTKDPLTHDVRFEVK